MRAEQLLRGVASDLSFRQLALRPGVLLGLQQPRLELRYAAEAVHWQGGDDYSSGPLWYSEAHRGEFEIDASEQLMAFGGAGYRLFRDRVRSRFEIDQGVAWGLPLSPTLDLTLGGSARWYRARAHAYTQLGATGLAQLDVSLPSRLLLRETGSVSGDLYPYSESYFPSAGGAQRQELLVRTMIGLWWPIDSPLRGAIEYSYTSRTSTASAYQFDDHRLLLRLRWSLDSDRFGNTVIPRAGRVPLASAEGFIRQILGWREYVRGIYWTQMPGYLERNALGACEPLPEFYWTGATSMACLADAITQTLRHGYAHHIQRLMITGLYALLLGVEPRAVHAWYLSVYVDAVEWVELPNTLGMSQAADGGMMASKPYIASGKYIQRMSGGSQCARCRFDPNERTGARACPFTTMYWDFLMRHETLLSANPRTVMQTRNLVRVDRAERALIARRAAAIRAGKLETS